MTARMTLNASSPSYPRPLFLPLRFLISVLPEEMSDCGESMEDTEGKIALARREGSKLS